MTFSHSAECENVFLSEVLVWALIKLVFNTFQQTGWICLHLLKLAYKVTDLIFIKIFASAKSCFGVLKI
jgi:hypothetical protein